MVKRLQGYLHVGTFLEVNKQWWVFLEVVWAGSLLMALNVGHLQPPQDLGQGWTLHVAPVESQTQLMVVALTSGVETSFVLERKNLCPLTQVWRGRLSLANCDLDEMAPRMI
ncbi:hypothetical protein BTVI_03320 [Pitangus sulphuratus]|nr:hypothetical protein BTVI_03320 [Pitangus sulphuratus]